METRVVADVAPEGHLRYSVIIRKLKDVVPCPWCWVSLLTLTHLL